MEIIAQYLQEISWDTIILTAFRLVLILLLAWGVMIFVSKILARLETRLLERSQEEGEPPNEGAKRTETLFRLIRQAVLVAVSIIVGLIVLREIGVDITPILAGAGILGLAVGFGAQNLVRDIISGFFFLLENQVRVGDVAVVNGTGGLVEKVNFRTLVLRDLSGVVHIFPNGTVTTLSNMTNKWSAYVFDIGVAYKENTDRVIEVLQEVGRELRADPELGPLILEDLEIFGVDKFADSAVVIKCRIKTRPIRQWMVGREYLRRVKQAFDRHHIEIPRPHRTMYFGEASKPVDLRLLSQGFQPTPIPPDQTQKPV